MERRQLSMSQFKKISQTEGYKFQDSKSPAQWVKADPYQGTAS